MKDKNLPSVLFKSKTTNANNLGTIPNKADNFAKLVAKSMQDERVLTNYVTLSEYVAQRNVYGVEGVYLTNTRYHIVVDVETPDEEENNEYNVYLPNAPQNMIITVVNGTTASLLLKPNVDDNQGIFYVSTRTTNDEYSEVVLQEIELSETATITLIKGERFWYIVNFETYD